jgi:hypothetical protein
MKAVLAVLPTAILCIAAMQMQPVISGQQASPSSSPSPDACDAASEKLFGRLPARVSVGMKEPKKLKHVTPQYPEVPPGTRGTGVWLGEALIDPEGRVRKVSVLRDLKFEPPFPAVSVAIADAILQWKYTPTNIDGKPVPVCMTVSVNIHWR